MPRPVEENNEEYCPNCNQYTGGETVCPNCGAILQSDGDGEFDGFHEESESVEDEDL